MSSSAVNGLQPSKWSALRRRLKPVGDWLERFDTLIGAFVSAILAGVLGFIGYQAQQRLEKIQEEQVIESIHNAERAIEQSEESRRTQVLTAWLPRFLNQVDGDRSDAERMILALLGPKSARELFSELEENYRAAGLLDSRLEDILGRAIAQASRAEAQTPVYVVNLGIEADSNAADERVQEAVDLGFSNVVVHELEDEKFLVVIDDLPNEQAAELIRVEADRLSGDVSVSDLSEIVTGTEAEIPNVYGQTRSDALAALAEAGFTDVVVWLVESNSVAAGDVRQLILNDGSSLESETIIVDRTGPTKATLTNDTRLILKISRGSS